MKATRHAAHAAARHMDGFDLKAVVAAVVFTLTIVAVALHGHRQATAAHDSQSAHHMASLAQIQAVMKQAKDAGQ
ncbi:MAG TPA: hypothetical protein VGG27_10635 [Magnetospirillaceae bacterium]|jgi:hypothetical protein